MFLNATDKLNPFIMLVFGKPTHVKITYTDTKQSYNERLINKPDRTIMNPERKSPRP